MSSVLRALESFLGNEAAWHEWTALLIRPDLPVVAALRHAARTRDDQTLRRLASLLEDARFPDRLFNAFATHPEFRGSQIDVARLHFLMQAAVAAARLAIQMQDVGIDHAAEAVWNASSTQPEKLSAGQVDVIGLALAHLKDAGYGPTVLVRWMGDYLGVKAEAVDHVPLACVIDGCRGVLASLTLTSWRTVPGTPPAVVPDLEAALTPMHDDLLTALAAVVPTQLTRSISWRIGTPPTLRASNLSGGSLQGAAAVALHLINGGERFHRGVLILAESREGRLRPVGYEHLKLLAAIESYDRGRASGAASEEQSSIQKVIISEESACNMAPADARGMPWIRLRTVQDAAKVVADAARVAEERIYQIARATRTIKAVSAPPEHRYVVETASGKVIFGPESRTDFISEVTFKDNNRLRDPYKLHYRAQAVASRVEADCHPAEDNLYFEDPAYANYEQDKRVYEFRFVPSPGASYSLTAHVFDGFGAGSRNMHCHFADNAVFDLLIFELDLQAYESCDSRFSLRHDMDYAPRLSIWRSIDPQLSTGGEVEWNRKPAQNLKRGQSVCDRYCAMARTAPTVPPARASQGLWRWEIQKVRFGAVLWIDWEKTVGVRD